MNYEDVGLKREEYDEICKRLKRSPNDVELLLFSAMWSEHCGYKHSKALIKRYFRANTEENAGIIWISDDIGIAFKVESHNHPSAVEPFQGAATGVGGIIRDIIAMGARPIAILDSLTFGLPKNRKTRYLLEGVVSGISSYGNSIGVPTVGGEVRFDISYENNPLVNVMAVGVLKRITAKTSRAKGVGNSLILVGSKTGRDGIHGASFASRKLREGSYEDRPSVQVGDPFTEKKLIEVTLELCSLPQVVAVQDMGAAGILSSSSEMARKGGMGVDLFLEKVPLREKMTPAEIMLSESQERMLFAVEKGKEKEIFECGEKWELDVANIGVLTDTGNMRLYWHDEKVADVPLCVLVDAPSYEKESFSISRSMPSLPMVNEPVNLEEVFLKLLYDPTISSKRWVYTQYDHMVGTSTVVLPGDADAAIMSLGEGVKGIGVTIDSNGRYCNISPEEGVKAVLFEAYANLIASGCRPLGITDGLNFGDPDDDRSYHQFSETIRGIAEGCAILNIPVTGGNVSFYNRFEEKSIYPTPVIGMVGKCLNVTRGVKFAFDTEGDKVYVVGEPVRGQVNSGSVYRKYVEGEVGSVFPNVDWYKIKEVFDFMLSCVEKNIFTTVHDISDGGLAIAVAECCISEKMGFIWEAGEPNANTLFEEIPGRFVVSIPNSKCRVFEEMAHEDKIPFEEIGSVGGTDADFKVFKLPIPMLTNIYEGALKEELDLH